MRKELEEIEKDRVITEAKAELSKLEAIKVLIKNNDFGLEIHICNMVIGLCNNSKILPVINYQIIEIKKFLKREKNCWE